MKPKKGIKRILMFAAAGILLGAYLYILFLSFHPNVTEDYRTRYLEEGYFYGEGENNGQSSE